MDHRIDAIYGRQSIDKKDSISIESQFEFCRYELTGGEGKEYKDKGYSGKNIIRPVRSAGRRGTLSRFQRANRSQSFISQTCRLDGI